jgi:hypothetical protein
MRLPAGRTVSQALEAQRIKLAEIAATEVGILQRYKPQRTPEPEPMRLSAAIRRYLDQIDTLKKPNTYRKYDAVLTRFDEHFPGRELPQISNEELNDFIIKLRKSGLAANTVLHNVIIIAQFCRRNGRPNLTRDLCQWRRAKGPFWQRHGGPGRHRWMAAKEPATFDGHAGLLTALAQAREKEARAAGGWSAIDSGVCAEPEPAAPWRGMRVPARA